MTREQSFWVSPQPKPKEPSWRGCILRIIPIVARVYFVVWCIGFLEERGDTTLDTYYKPKSLGILGRIRTSLLEEQPLTCPTSCSRPLSLPVFSASHQPTWEILMNSSHHHEAICLTRCIGVRVRNRSAVACIPHCTQAVNLLLELQLMCQLGSCNSSIQVAGAIKIMRSNIYPDLADHLPTVQPNCYSEYRFI